MSTDPLDWLRAQILARKAKALAADPGPWKRDYHAAFMHGIVAGNGRSVNGEALLESHNVNHIVANDPRQIAADCEYQLAELARHEGTHRCDWGDYHGPDIRWCSPIRRLAGIYRHHDGYPFEDAP